LCEYIGSGDLIDLTISVFENITSLHNNAVSDIWF